MAITKHLLAITIFISLCTLSCKKNNSDLQNDVEDVRVFQVDSGGCNNSGMVWLTDGNLLIYGNLNIFGLYRYVFIKYSPDGKIIWQKNYIPKDHVIIYNVLQDKNGGYITVSTDDIQNTLNFDRYDSAGGKVDSARNSNYPAAATNYQLAAMLDSDGNIVAVGSTPAKIFFIKYSPDWTLLVNQVTYLKDSLPDNAKFCIKITQDEASGFYYVQGRYRGTDYYNNFLMQISSDGTMKWFKYTVDTQNAIEAGCVIKEGKIHAFSSEGPETADEYTGFSSTVYYGGLYHEIYDTDGLFYSRERIKNIPDDCIFTSLLRTSDGYLFAGTTGYVGGNKGYVSGEYVSPSRVVLVKLDPNFNLQWPPKTIESTVPSLGIDAVEVNANYYVSGTALFADSVAFMMLLKTPAE